MFIYGYCEGFGLVCFKIVDRFKGFLLFIGDLCWTGRFIGVSDFKIINIKDVGVKFKFI